MSTNQNGGCRLCELDSLPDRSERGFSVHWRGRSLELLLVRRGKDVYGYLNSCPHTGATLNWLPDQFLDAGGRHIQCATHGALFRVDNGACISGPCAGQSLTPVPVAIDAGWVKLVAGEGGA